MKVCPSCNAQQSNQRSVCIECGEVLGRPIPAKQSEPMRKETDKIRHIASQKSSEGFTLLNKIMVYASLAGMLIAIVLGQNNFYNSIGLLCSVAVFCLLAFLGTFVFICLEEKSQSIYFSDSASLLFFFCIASSTPQWERHIPFGHDYSMFLFAGLKEASP